MGDEQTQTIRRTESGYRYELSGLRTACADAMITIGTSNSMDSFNAAVNRAISSLDTLEDHIAPYVDKDFREDRDGKVDGRKKGAKKEGGYAQMKCKSRDKILKDNPKIEDPDKITEMVEMDRLETLRQQQRARYRALMKLMDRKNLLLEEETEDYAG